MSWDKWDKPLTDKHWFNFYLSIERIDDTKTNWYIVDRVRFYKEEKTEEVKPTSDQDPPGLIPARKFSAGLENIGKTLAKLKEKKPVNIVIAGDSLPWGAQLGYLRKNSNGSEQEMRTFTYWWLLAERLKDFYGYESVAINFASFDHAKKTWFYVPEKDKRAKADLTHTAIAVGGWEVGQGIENLDKILDEKPDLVIWEYGANDSFNSHFAPAKGLGHPGYVKQMKPAIDKLQAAGAEVVLHTLTPAADVVLPHCGVGERKGIDLVTANILNSETIRTLAAEKKCGLADMDGALRARGILFVGDLYVDMVHLNHRGHEMMADVLDAMLTGRDIKIWRYGPAADRLAPSTQPASPAHSNAPG
jgi:lysophospholipase L1-like esterase